MSNWSRAEVMELDGSTGGGNAIHNATYLAKLPPTYRRPQKGCHPNDMKDFVQVTYIDLRWHDASGQAAPAAPAPAPAPAAPPSQRTANPSRTNPPRIAAVRTAPLPPTGSVDLLGLDLSDPAPAPATNGSTPAGWASFGGGGGSADPFASSIGEGSFVDSSWTAFDSASAPPASFGDFTAAAAASPAPAFPATFDSPLAATPAPTVAAAPAAFDGFGAFASAAPAPAASVAVAAPVAGAAPAAALAPASAARVAPPPAKCISAWDMRDMSGAMPPQVGAGRSVSMPAGVGAMGAGGMGALGMMGGGSGIGMGGGMRPMGMGMGMGNGMMAGNGMAGGMMGAGTMGGMMRPAGMGCMANSGFGGAIGASPMAGGMGASTMGGGMGASPMGGGMGASPMGGGMGASPMAGGMGASPMAGNVGFAGMANAASAGAGAILTPTQVPSASYANVLPHTARALHVHGLMLMCTIDRHVFSVSWRHACNCCSHRCRSRRQARQTS